MPEVYEQIDQEVKELGEQFSEWRHSKKLHELSGRLRKVGSHFCKRGLIKGFVAEVNGVDVSTRPLSWPEHVFKAEKLQLRLQVLGVEAEPKRCLVEHEFGGEAKKPAAEPVVPAAETEEVPKAESNEEPGDEQKEEPKKAEPKRAKGSKAKK